VIRALIFDLDGTLVDSLPGIASAINLALKELGLPTHPEEQVMNFIGDGAAKLALRALPDSHKHLADLLLPGFQKHYQETWKTGTHPYPGMIKLVQSLQAAKYPLAVLSNKIHENTIEIVAHLFPKDLFHPVFGQRDSAPKNPDPTVALEIAQQWNLPPQEIAYVGDSAVDLATARNAGMIPLIFSWGYGTPTEFDLLDNAAELEEAIHKY